MAEAQETGFMKFISKHIEYPAINALIDYHDMSREGKSEGEIFKIIEIEKIPPYRKMIKAKAEECARMNKPRLGIAKIIGLYF